MFQSDNRGSRWKETAIACFTGFCFGGTNTIVGHPFDTVKTKMQAQSNHIGVEGQSRPTYLGSIKQVYYKEGGFKGFYRGWVPPFIGSCIFRSAQFTVYEVAHTSLAQREAMCQAIPFTFGLQWKILIAGWAGGSVRAFIECPFEYAKVKRQTGQTWTAREAFSGMLPQYIRGTGLMTVYFCCVDYYRRYTNLWSYRAGQFWASASSAVFGFWVIWPFEVIKNVTQAGNLNAGNTMSERARFIY